MLQLQTSGAKPNRHVLPYSYFAALSAGRGDADAIRFLWHTQRSRRLLLITALFDEAEQLPDMLGVLPSAEPARRMLARAQIEAPAAVDELLLHPQVGAWAAYVLRRRRSGSDRSEDVPFWVDFGGLYSLCLIAAARAGLSWRTRLPHRHGRVMLFGMGMALFPELAPGDLIDAETIDGRITLVAGARTIVLPDPPDAKSAYWWGLRRLRTGDDLPLTVWLDDLDPLRDLADPVPPERLDDSDVAVWRGLLDEAWALLCEHHREDAEAIAEGVVSLVPLPRGDGWETRSASSGESFGSVMVSPPPDAPTLAVSLVHEFQHIKLGGLMHLMPLTADDEVPRYYAPWRDDPRPLGGLLQGVYAFLGIAAFWRRHRHTVSGLDERLAGFEYAYARAQTHEALGIALASGGLTDQGRTLVNGLVIRVEPWLSEELGPAISAAVRTVADHHRTGWRIRHQRIREEEVDALAEAWHRGQPAVIGAAPPKVAPAPATRWSQGMLGLVRRRITEPDSWRTSEHAAADLWDAAISAGDIALVDGDAETALGCYTALLRDDHKNSDTWSGLALALRSSGPEAAARALGQRPELVQAVYGRLVEADLASEPVQVAQWLGEALVQS